MEHALFENRIARAFLKFEKGHGFSVFDRNVMHIDAPHIDAPQVAAYFASPKSALLGSDRPIRA
jgi:hypothetical protein